MSSNNINTCASRINQQFRTYNVVISDIRDLRVEITRTSGPDKQDLETLLQMRTEEKTDRARNALNTQIQLLNLVVGSGWATVPPHIQTALNRIFSGDGLAELRERFEAERDAVISDDGQLADSNANGMSSFRISYNFHMLTICSFETSFSADKKTDPLGSETTTH